jgi:DNA-binding LacI/PurR family transcriptional regulator
MVTLSKLAKLAHVSVSTVSKAFSMSPEVNEQTREQIFNLARELGCFKKYYKAQYPKLVIAVLCPEFKSRLYSQSLSVLQEHFSRHNCEICVASTEFSEEKERELMAYYNRHTSVDGIVVIGQNGQPDPDLEIPVAYVGGKNAGCFRVDLNLQPAAEQAVEYFISHGVTDIGFVSEPHTERKLRIFQEQLAQQGYPVPPHRIAVSEKRFEAGGYEAMERLLSADVPPRAVICGYDYMAIGAIRCIYDRGLSVPEDIAVLGMDNLYEAKYLNPPLSSMDYPIDRACTLAAEALLAELMGQPHSRWEEVEAILHLRRSTEME